MINICKIEKMLIINSSLTHLLFRDIVKKYIMLTSFAGNYSMVRARDRSYAVALKIGFV